MAGKKGLIPVKRMVVRGGKTYLTTVYVRPEQETKSQQNKNIEIPDWFFKTSAEFDAESKRIAKIKDPVEKRVLREQLMKDLKAFGIAWKEDNGTKADAVNWMRCAMATKKFLDSGKEIKLGAKSETVLGTGKPMKKEDARKAISDLRKEIGTEKMIELAKDNGISWKENPNHLANNYMRCAMALRQHLENGGVLTQGSKQEEPKKAQKPVKEKETKAPKEKEPPSDTIEYDYYHASPRGKIIAHLTGIIPTDKESEDYMYERLKNGDFDVAEQNIKIPAKVRQTIDDFIVGVKYSGIARYQRRLKVSILRNNEADEMFKGHPREQDYLEFKKLRIEFDDKYGKSIYYRGAREIVNVISIMETFRLLRNELQKDINTVTKPEALTKLGELLQGNKADEVWEKMNVQDWLTEESTTSRTSAHQLLDILGKGMAWNASAVKRRFAQRLRQEYPELDGLSMTTMFENDLQITREGLDYNGRKIVVPKKEMMRILGETIVDQAKDRNFVPENDTVNNEIWFHNQVLSNFASQHKFNPDKINIAQIINYANRCANDYNKVTDPKFDWVERNLIIFDNVKKESEQYVSEFKAWKPLSEEDIYANGLSALSANIKKHAHLMRLSEKRRERETKNRLHDSQYLLGLLENGKNEEIEETVPSLKEVKGKLKASVETVKGAEKKDIEKRIHESHDTANHRFKTKVNNVFRIKKLPIEEKFRQIDQERDNTGFYYHGTSYRSSQLIVGKSGQFKVTRQVNAGRMLGDGVYLASESSKSVQYASRSYGRNNASGVLFICEASLGKVKASKYKDETYNRKLLNKDPETDTLFMDRPYVLNPEWAVKQAEAVIPRYWIDVERKRD